MRIHVEKISPKKDMKREEIQCDFGYDKILQVINGIGVADGTIAAFSLFSLWAKIKRVI